MQVFTPMLFIFSFYKHLCTRHTMHTYVRIQDKEQSPLHRFSVQLTSPGPLLLLVVGPRSDPRHSASRGLGEWSWSSVVHPPKKNS